MFAVFIVYTCVCCKQAVEHEQLWSAVKNQCWAKGSILCLWCRRSAPGTWHDGRIFHGAANQVKMLLPFSLCLCFCGSVHKCMFAFATACKCVGGGGGGEVIYYFCCCLGVIWYVVCCCLDNCKISLVSLMWKTLNKKEEEECGSVDLGETLI